MVDKKISQLILDDREKRYEFLCKTLNEYKLTVLCGKINYPSNNKNTFEANKAFYVLYDILKERFKGYIKFEKILEGYDGKALINVLDIPLREAKKISIEIEESHSLGRLFDIDVYDLNGIPIDREQLGFKRRRCILCGDEARICIANRKHSLNEILEVVNNLILEYKG
ncbi:citrate lyase holo-[acyl-carrier protein] synthase [Caloramator sp. E03]|uniref:citrate lyase holo-[acyl-carrier protein] synthase n=1 Tax=Caloramator sp. E03 TaxID=2576307 RepID=UPI001110CEC8|nr:citrate lyase holo-[acyl-carrier protein] synthase [Caloramator sp. E03]QCX33048.1 citrate lyase holo-[acyl-carrier protein] synthase [Caloramator sp. E03]